KVDITEGANKTGVSNVKIDGGVLNLNGKNLGSGSTAATGAIDNLTILGGTLRNIGLINSNGSVNMTGTSTLILDGSNTYTGGTNIARGTVQMGAGSGTGTAGSGSISINGGANLAFNRSDSAGIFTNAISGGGGLHQNGSGMVTLAGANTFGGD